MAKKKTRQNGRDGRGRPGQGVDAFGQAVYDPTQNVKDLTEAANLRQDDLRALTKELGDVKIQHQKEMADARERHRQTTDAIRERYQEVLRKAESDRLDSIRQVDREDVNKTAAQALSAIATLASATTTTAETLRGQVATTAQAAATSLANSMGEVNKRLSALELSYSEGRGKATVESPMMAEMVSKIEALTLTIASNSGQKQGAIDARIWLGWAIAALVGLFALFQTVRGR